MAVDEDQIDALLRDPSESLRVELKTWLDPRSAEGIAKLVKAIFAVRNRNGGFLIIGFDNATRMPDPYAIDEDVNVLYHADKIQGLVSRYANVAFEIEIKLREREGRRHPVIVVPGDVRVPTVVKRDLSGDGGQKLLQEGDVYFRTLNSNGMASSARLAPRDYPDLLEICFENREADIGRFLRRHLSSVDPTVIAGIFGAGGAAASENLHSRSFSVIETGNAAFLAAVEKRGALEALQSVSDLLTMHVGMALDPAKPDELPTREFMNKVAGSNPQYSNPPIWLVTPGFHENADRAYVIDGAWQALIIDLEGGWSKQFEFMRLDPRGEFYLRRVMQDDLSKKVKPGTALDVILMIYRVTEALAVGVSIARGLGWDRENTAGFAFRWTGLSDRKLLAWVDAFRSTGSSGQSSSAMAESFVSIPLETPHAALAPYVARAVAPLFSTFNGYSPSKDLVEQCVRKVIERRMSS